MTTPAVPRWAKLVTILIPGLWLGMILGISGIEAPLKFTAPGITIPLGLGIGRRVFLAMNIVEIVFALIVIIALIAMRGSQLIRQVRVPWIVVMVVLLAKTGLIRPLLAQHTDAVLSGEFSGGSNTHLVYIAAEVVLTIALIWAFRNASRAVVK